MADELDSLLARLNAGPESVELTTDELFLLEAYLAQRVPLGEMAERSKQNAKLCLIQDYNRALQASRQPISRPDTYAAALRAVELLSGIVLYVLRPRSVDDRVALQLVRMLNLFADALVRLDDGRRTHSGELPTGRVEFCGRLGRNYLEIVSYIGWRLIESLELVTDTKQFTRRMAGQGGKLRTQTMLQNWHRLEQASTAVALVELQSVDLGRLQFELEYERDELESVRPSGLAAENACREFIRLAREIVARIETHKAGDWWDRIVHLAHDLETVRRQLPDANLSGPDLPAIRISDRWQDGRRVSTLTLCDPLGVAGSATSLQRFDANETMARTVQTLTDWIRAVERLAAEQPTPPAAEKPTPPAADGADKPAGDEYAELRQFAADNLKGKQRRIVELLADAGGSVPIADAASDPAVAWQAPYDNAVKSMIRALNANLKGWRVFRQSNELRVKSVSRLPPS